MTAVALLDVLRARGVVVAVEGERLTVRPWALVTEAEREGLREHRSELPALLAPVEQTEERDDEPTPPGPTPQDVAMETPPLAASVAAVPPPLPEDEWEACGIYRWNGVPTHSRGDQHAALIITGEIPVAQAVAAQRATQAMRDNISRFGLRRTR